MDELIRLAPTHLCYTHFGGVTQPLNRFKDYKQRLILWARTIADCLEKGQGNQDMYQAIRAKDADLARLDRLPPDQRGRELYFIKNSILGFVGYLERYGSQYLKQL